MPIPVISTEAEVFLEVGEVEKSRIASITMINRNARSLDSILLHYHTQFRSR